MYELTNRRKHTYAYAMKRAVWAVMERVLNVQDPPPISRTKVHTELPVEHVVYMLPWLWVKYPVQSSRSRLLEPKMVVDLRK